MNIDRIDVAEKIKTRILLEKKLGAQTSEILMKHFENLLEETTLLIDLTGADVVDYNFCSAAIGPLVKSLEDSKLHNKYIIVRVDQEQKPIILDGILFHVSGIRSDKNSLESFVENNLSIKLQNSETNKLEFVGKLNEVQEKILKIINDQNKITANDIAVKMKKTIEEIIQNLNELKRQFFIYDKNIENEVFYCSFNIFKENGE